jgi:hypothetical protein
MTKCLLSDCRSIRKLEICLKTYISKSNESEILILQLEMLQENLNCINDEHIECDLKNMDKTPRSERQYRIAKDTVTFLTILESKYKNKHIV